MLHTPYDVDHRGDRVWSSSYGVREIQNRETENTIFKIVLFKIYYFQNSTQ